MDEILNFTSSWTFIIIMGVALLVLIAVFIFLRHAEDRRLNDSDTRRAARRQPAVKGPTAG